MDLGIATEYLIFTTVSTFSALQIVSSVKDKPVWRTLESKKITILISIILIIISFVWFFSLRDRNIQTNIEGVELFFIFGIGSILTLIITKILKRVYEFRRD